MTAVITHSHRFSGIQPNENKGFSNVLLLNWSTVSADMQVQALESITRGKTVSENLCWPSQLRYVCCFNYNNKKQLYFTGLAKSEVVLFVALQ